MGDPDGAGDPPAEAPGDGVVDGTDAGGVSLANPLQSLPIVSVRTVPAVAETTFSGAALSAAASVSAEFVRLAA
jgi:hypothetical protein